MNVYFIVVAFNSKKSQTDYFLNQFKGKNLIVVENTSEYNLGYGGGANEGIKEALDKGAEWVVVMNQDLKITKSAVEESRKKLEETEPGIAGPFTGRLDPNRWTTILNKENKDGFRLPASKCGAGSGRNDARFWTSQNDDKTGSPIRLASLALWRSGTGMTKRDGFRVKLGMTERFDYISGAFIAIHRKVFEKIGLFYESYFMYYEDADICVRAKKVGFPLTQIKVKNIEHEESTSLGRGSFKHEYYLARNHLLFIERNAPTGVKFHEMLRMPKTLWEHYKKKNWGALTGVRDYVLRRFDEFG